MKRLFFSFLSIALCAFAVVSCDKENKDEENGGKKGREAGTYIPYTQQQDLIAQAISVTREKIDITPAATALRSMVARAKQPFDLSQVLVYASQDERLAEVMTLLVSYITSPEIQIDFEKFYMKAEFEVTDSLNDKGEKIAVICLDTVSYDSDCMDLDIRMDGHTYCIKLNGENASGAAVNYRTSEESKGTLIYLPKTFNLSVSYDGYPLLSLDLGLNSDMVFYILNPKDSGLQLGFQGTKLNLNAGLTLGVAEVDGKVDLDMSKGMDLYMSFKSEGKKLLALNAALDASLDGIKGSDKSSIVEWAMDPTQLRKVNGSIVYGDDDMKIVASIENPFKDQEVGQTIVMAIAGAQENPQALEQLNKCMDKLNGLVKCEVYFKGFSEPQATLKFTEINTAQSGSVTEAILGAVSVVTFDEKGEEVTLPVMEYLGDSGLLEQLSGLSRKLIAVL